MKKVGKIITKYKKELTIGPILKLVEAIIEVIIPIIIAKVIDNIFVYSIDDKIKIGSIILLITIFGYVFASISQYMATKVSQSIGKLLRLELFKHIFKIPNKYLDKIGSLAIVNRLTNDIFNIEIAIAMWIRLVIRVPFICIASLVMIGFINMKIALMVFVSTIIFSLAIYIIIKVTIPLFKKANKALDKLLAKTKEEIINIKIIRSFVTENSELNKFDKINEENFKYSKKANIFSSLLSPITSIILNITIILILINGNIQIKSNLLTQGELIAIINYVTQILISVIILSNLISIYTKAFSSINRVNDIFDVEEEKETGTIEKVIEGVKDIIRFENVNFSYNNKNLLLKNINVNIKKGEIIGIIGTTSSGKSTFLELINRSYIPNSGNIFFYDLNLSEYTDSYIKKNIKIIEQNPIFLRDSIKNNIKLSYKADNNEINKAVVLSEVDEFIKTKSEGLDYIIKNDGNNLSGGQKQRIALARMFMGKPKIIILDNITSALDLKTESRVINNIINYVNKNDITLLIASQKVNIVKKCDKILVFDSGYIVGYGTHEELLKNCDLYNYINMLQN